MNKLRVVVAVATVAILVGCDNDDFRTWETDKKPVISISAGDRTYDQLSTNDVLVSVNGAELTKGELERQIAFRIALAKLRPLSKMDDRKLARLRSELLRSCDRQFIMQELMKSYAKKHGVSPSDDDSVKMREQLIKTYVRGGNYRKFVKSLSKENQLLLGQNSSRELWTKKGREKLIADNLKPVEDADVKKRREYFTEYNKRAAEVLAKAWLDATNVWKKATAGCPFQKLVAQYENGDDEHVSAEAEWGELKASDYKDDKELYRVLTTTPEGCIPPPFEGDNGLLVVKIVKITPPDSDKGQTEPLFMLSKIFFELPELWEEQSDAEIRADLKKINERNAFRQGLQSLVDSSKIDYPCGTNLFRRASSKRPVQLPASVRNRLPHGMKLPE